MITQMLVCYPDGTQAMEDREVADDWFTPAPAAPAPPTEDEKLRADLDYVAMQTGVAL